MGDLPKINGKIGKKFPNRGRGGSMIWENSHIFPFVFLGDVPNTLTLSLLNSFIPDVVNSFESFI